MSSVVVTTVSDRKRHMHAPAAGTSRDWPSVAQYAAASMAVLHDPGVLSGPGTPWAPRTSPHAPPPPEGSSSSLPPDGQERPAGSSDVTSSRLAGARSGAPCASEQLPSSTAATTTPTAAMSRAKTGAVAPHPTHHLVWRLLARARGAASWAGSFGASWCSAGGGRSRIPHACALRRLRRASNRRCGQLYPPAARQDCRGSSIGSRCCALLTRPQIGSGGRLLRRRSEL